MRKILGSMAVFMMVFALAATGCEKSEMGSSSAVSSALNTSSVHLESESSIAVEQGISVDQMVDSISASLKVTNIQVKEAALIGADEGKGFIVNEKDYEIYEFNDSQKLEEAKTGKLVFKLEAFGDIEMNCTINKNLVLTYLDYDQNVIDAFLAAQ